MSDEIISNCSLNIKKWRNQISLFKITDLSYTVEAKHKFNNDTIIVTIDQARIRDLIPEISTLKSLKTTMFKPEKF